MDQLELLYEIVYNSGTVLLHLWYVTIPLALAAVVALILTRAYEPLSQEPAKWGILIPIAIPILIALIGVLSGSLSRPLAELLGDLITILFFLHLPLGAVLLWKMRGMRIFALAFHLNVIWWSSPLTVFSVWFGGMS